MINRIYALRLKHTGYWSHEVITAISHEPHAILQQITKEGYQSIMLRLMYDDYRKGAFVHQIVVVKLIGD
jgi:hypothetical protein